MGILQSRFHRTERKQFKKKKRRDIKKKRERLDSSMWVAGLFVDQFE